MKKLPTPLLIVSLALPLGAVIVSCLNFSTNPSLVGTGGSTGGGNDVGGTTGGSELGGGTGSGAMGGATGSQGGATGGNEMGGATGSQGGSTGASLGGSPGAGGRTGTGGITGAAGAPATGAGGALANGPCDVLNAAGNTCVAAHSTVRALYKAYTGPLYQVCKGTSAPGPNSCPGGNIRDIAQVAGGFADSAAQDSFCAGGACTISVIYDQSPNGNHLKPAPAGGFKNSPDNPANAADLKVTINGHSVYGVFIKVGMGYRAGCTGCGVVTPRGTAVADQPETEYMITSQNGLIDGCCFDYGNAETTARDDGNGTMEAIYMGGGVVWGTGTPGAPRWNCTGATTATCSGNGPWLMADLENGLYAGWENNQDQAISTNTALKFNFITAVLVGDVASMNANRGRFALYGGDATAGSLKIMYDGIRPSKGGYVPMHKQGSIILGIGGDNSDNDGGQWFEGVMASGAATLATVNALQANIVAARYGK